MLRAGELGYNQILHNHLHYFSSAKIINFESLIFNYLFATTNSNISIYHILN